MKKWLRAAAKVAGAILFVLLIILAAAIFHDERDEAVIAKYVKNENLPTVRDDWKGTPIDEKGRFVNDEFPFLSKTGDVLKWQLSVNPQKREKAADAERLTVLDPADFLNDARDGILWLGHGGVFIRLGGAHIVVDPVFGKPPFVDAYIEISSPLDKIKRIDYILLSHDHRDHTDENTVRQIAEKFPNAKILAGLGMQELLNDWKTPTNEVETAGWYQQFSVTGDRLKIVFVPVRHWCRRGLFDANKRLWGGFVVEAAGKTIYLGGDSGYGAHYGEVARLFPSIDYAILGIGAYEPRWFMHPNHNSPEDAWRAFADTKANRLIPVHYGTFDLSDEPPGEPLRLLRQAAEKSNAADKVKNLQIYESLDF